MKQTTYTRFAADVHRDDDGDVVLTIALVHSHPMGRGIIVDEVLNFPMAADYAAEVGQKLSAPSVVVPKTGDV